MFPQLAVGSGTPTPKKLNDDSTSTVLAKLNVAHTTVTVMICGKMWRKIM